METFHKIEWIVPKPTTEEDLEDFFSHTGQYDKIRNVYYVNECDDKNYILEHYDCFVKYKGKPYYFKINSLQHFEALAYGLKYDLLSNQYWTTKANPNFEIIAKTYTLEKNDFYIQTNKNKKQTIFIDYKKTWLLIIVCESYSSYRVR